MCAEEVLVHGKGGTNDSKDKTEENEAGTVLEFIRDISRGKADNRGNDEDWDCKGLCMAGGMRGGELVDDGWGEDGDAVGG